MPQQQGQYTAADIDQAKPQGQFTAADIDQLPPAPAKTSLNAAPKPFTLPWFKQEATNFAEGATKNLPAIGATIGGMAGAPAGGPVGAVGGAGIGGMGGAAASQILRRILFGEGPQTSSDAAKDITKQGVTQAGIQGVTEGLPFLAGPLKKAATAQYERALAPTTKINKAITQKIAPQMIDRGVQGSLGGMEERASAQATNLKPQLDAAYQATPASATVGSGSQIVRDLENLKGKYTVQGMPANPNAVNAISGVQDVVKQYGNDIAPDSLRKLKQIFDDPVAARGGYAGADLTTAYTLKAQKAAANSIRSIMSQASPDVAALNKEVSFWLDVQRVTKQSGLRRTGQEGGLLKTLWPAAAGAVGFEVGGVHGLEAALGTAATAKLYQALRSPTWRTFSAVQKSRLADALASGDAGQVMALTARLGQSATQLPWGSQQSQGQNTQQK